MLTALGINETFFFQMGIFIVTLIFLSQVVFKPYYQAYRRRQEVIDPEEDFRLKDLRRDTEEKKMSYEKKVQDLHQTCQGFYLQVEKEALLGKEKRLKEASDQSQKDVEVFKKNLNLEAKKYLENLEVRSEGISQLILEKVFHLEKEEKRKIE